MDVELYTSPSCPHCSEAKTFAEELARDKPQVRLRLIDVSHEEGAKSAFENKVLTLPTFLIRDGNGELRISGYDKDKLIDYFDRQTQSPAGDGPRFMKIGAGLGLYSLLTYLLAGSICPACVIVAPASFAYGFFKQYLDRPKKSSTGQEMEAK